MPTIDEIFDTMPVSEETTFEYLTIDPDARTIQVPASEAIFGVQTDDKAERKYFMCPRYVGHNLDLASCFIQINYRNAHGDIDAYLVTDASYTDDTVTFSWELSEKVTAYQGQIQFSVNADNGKREWNTTMASGASLSGLVADESGIENETSDVVTQLRAMVEAQTAAVEKEGSEQIANVQAAASDATDDAKSAIETKGAATLASIPEDYTITVNKVNGLANAIKGSASGAVVKVNDVSPIEHTMDVKVESKNLIPFPYYHIDVTNARGVDVTVDEDGTITFNGTAEADSAYRLTQKSTMQVHGTFTLSGCNGGSDAAGKSTYYMQPFVDGVGTSALSNGSKTYTWDGVLTSIAIFFKAGVTFDNVQFKPQLERGSVATEYAPYVAPEDITLTRCGKNILDSADFTPNPDGSVSGVTSVSPNMTLATNKANVNIDCEYNRDTNVVIQNILAAIQVLGEML